MWNPWDNWGPLYMDIVYILTCNYIGRSRTPQDLVACASANAAIGREFQTHEDEITKLLVAASSQKLVACCLGLLKAKTSSAEELSKSLRAEVLGFRKIRSLSLDEKTHMPKALYAKVHQMLLLG
jgi:hypothetical protein